MKAGIVSDSHGHVEPLSRAIELLAARGAEAIVHCGDLGSVASLAPLADAPVHAYAVGGNTDGPCLAGLMHAAAAAGVTFSPQTVEVPLGDGRLLVAVHGHNEPLLEELVLGGQFPYVIHGHTHRCADQTFGSVRVICPGSLAHPRGPKYPTVAILDTESDTLRFIEVV